MKVVIQCAASKDPDAGYFRAADGKSVNFLADPVRAPRAEGWIHARPDDTAAADGTSWRDLVAEYNRKLGQENPLGLFPAYRLYLNRAYRDLVGALGSDKVYVLSAAWGLIRSDFLTPQYDITFSGQAEPYKRRSREDVYADFRHLDDGCEDPVIFFGGKDYLPLFCELSSSLETERIVFFNSKVAPQVSGCRLIRYQTTSRTNWHYTCVGDFLSGRLTIGLSGVS